MGTLSLNTLLLLNSILRSVSILIVMDLLKSFLQGESGCWTLKLVVQKTMIEDHHEYFENDVSLCAQYTSWRETTYTQFLIDWMEGYSMSCGHRHTPQRFISHVLSLFSKLESVTCTAANGDNTSTLCWKIWRWLLFGFDAQIFY